MPAAVAALLGVAETLLGPFWVWLFFGETPAPRTLVGGAMIVAALAGHLGWQIAAGRRARQPALHA